MATLLHIFAHPHPEKSQSLRVARAFIESYQQAHPDDTIEVLDLYQAGVPHLTEAHLTAMAHREGQGELSPEAAAAWEEMMRFVKQFLAADKYLVTSPLWNFGVPSIMKAYIDHIMLAGYTFNFTGPGASVGALTDRPVVIVSSRGGSYTQPPMVDMEMCVRYLSQIFDFLGAEVKDKLIVEGLALVGPHEQEKIVEPVVEKARQVAQTF